jgi:hypothetical protein
MICDLFDGSRGHLTPPPCEGVAKGRTDKSKSYPRSPEWAQARGLDAWLHLLDMSGREKELVRVHGIAKAG